MKPVDELLLLRPWQAGKAWLAPKRVFLLIRAEVLVLRKPLGKVLSGAGAGTPLPGGHPGA